jgi:hypothetical protein
VYRTSVRNPEGKRVFLRHKYIQKNNIKIDIKETVCRGMDWIHLTQIWSSGGLL